MSEEESDTTGDPEGGGLYPERETGTKTKEIGAERQTELVETTETATTELMNLEKVVDLIHEAFG